ncbi:MAG TPA: FAD:protein FMN transferase, partial [Ilumatobacteraceae bacterium]
AVVVTTEPEAIEVAVRSAKIVIDDVDRSCSRFRTDSDLERINEAAGRAVVVGPMLLEALDVALEAARYTGGDVDPTIGQSLRLLGYDRTFDDVDGGTAVARFAAVAGWQTVVVDRHRRTVRIPAGVRLDLGATAKALAADRAATAAAVAAGCGVMVALGGDIACAGVAPVDGWPVSVAEWHASPDIDDVIAIFDGGVATSSTTVRRWRRGDVEMHHVIDPATGFSATAFWRTVTVVASSCVQANIATTATIVRGEDAVSWLADLGVPARLVRFDGIVVHLGDWPIVSPA